MVIGADYYESDEQRRKVSAEGGVPLGIGANSVIKNCIVDKNARIGKNVVIENTAGVQVGTAEIGHRHWHMCVGSGKRCSAGDAWEVGAHLVRRAVVHTAQQGAHRELLTHDAAAGPH